MVRIEYGVPQGSVLGPLLFILYINDLKNALMSKLRLFADDTCLLIKNNNLKELQEQGNQDLNMLQSWMAANKLTINPTNLKLLLLIQNSNGNSKIFVMFWRHINLCS